LFKPFGQLIVSGEKIDGSGDGWIVGSDGVYEAVQSGFDTVKLSLESRIHGSGSYVQRWLSMMIEEDGRVTSTRVQLIDIKLTSTSTPYFIGRMIYLGISIGRLCNCI